MRASPRTYLWLLLLSAAGLGGVALGAATDKQPQEALYVNVYDDAGDVLDALKNLADAGEWRKAAETAQEHIAAEAGTLFEIEPGVYVSFAEKVRRVLCAWPDAGIKAYRAQYDPGADKLYEAAVKARSVRGLSEVARLYLPSSAGARALAARADIRIQRGELREAMRDLQSALALKRRTTLPRKSLKAKLASLRAAVKSRAGDGPHGAEPDWRALGGGAARRGLSRVPFSIGLRRWSFEIPGADIDRRAAAGLRARGLCVPRLVHPVVSGDKVFLQTTQWIAALRRETGETVWRYPRRLRAGSARDARDALPAPFVWRDRVFAFVGGEVVALSVTAGTRAWAVSNLTGEEPKAAGDDKGKARPRAPDVFVNSLAVADGMVLLCASAAKQETEAFVAALDAASGSTVWRRKLCSQVFRSYLGRGLHPAPPAFDEGVVYVSTNLGAVAAIEAETGEIRWLAKYNSFTPARRRVALRGDDCWENGAPVVYEGIVLAAPQDSDYLVALDASSGRQRWRAPRLGMRYLVGVADGRAYVSGRRAAALDVKTGRVLWLSATDWRPAGRPALTRSALLVPARQAMVRLDTKTGQVLSQYRLDTPRERGNLVLAGKLLLAASFDRVDAYGDASDMRAARSPTDFLRRGDRLERLDDAAGALRRYKQALSALDAPGLKAEPFLRSQVLAAMSPVHLRFGRALAAAGKHAQAEQSFALARRFAWTSRDAVKATFAIAECRERQGRWKEAVGAYQFAVERHRGAKFELPGGVLLPAPAAARAHIDRIIGKQGRAVYRAQDLKAAQLLDAARKGKDGRLFASVAEDYPNSRAAGEARKLLARLPGEAARRKLTRVWRAPFDTSRASPVLVPPSAESRPGRDEQLTFVIKDQGGARTYLWNAVECRRAKDGRLVWRTRVGPCLATALRTADKLILRGLSKLVALDAKTGRMLWTTRGDAREGPKDELPFGPAREARRIIDVTAGAGKVFAATTSKGIFAVDEVTGRELWRKELGQSVVVDSLRFVGGKLVVCGENPGTLHWLDPAKGAVLAKVALDRADNRVTDPPAFQARHARLGLVVGDRQVRNVALGTGKTLWKSEMPFSVGRIAATPDETRILVFPDRWSFGGKLTCFDAAGGRLLWSKPREARNPDGVHVGNNLVVSIRETLFRKVLTAQRMSDGSVAWSRVLRPEQVVDTITRAGDLLVASGSRRALDGWRGWAVVVHERDGAVVDTMAVEGAGYSSVKASGDTLVLCSDRGIEAYRPQESQAAVRDLAALLCGPGRRGLPADEAVVSEAARLLFVDGQQRAAMSWLDKALLTEPPGPASFAHLHEQLAAARQSASERSRITYGAPRFVRPPKIDGRLCEDWRSDRAAMLDKPRYIERVQSGALPKRFWYGPNDLSAKMYLGWDAKNLYLALDVSDDVQTTHDFDADEWRGDCLIVAIDPEWDGGYRLHGGDNLFWLALSAKPKRPDEDDDQRIGGEHRIKVKEDESGTVYELSIPWDDVGVERPRAGVRFGLNIMVIDDDSGRELKAVSWTPGLTQNRHKRFMSLGIAPALFGTVILEER